MHSKKSTLELGEFASISTPETSKDFILLLKQAIQDHQESSTDHAIITGNKNTLFVHHQTHIDTKMMAS